MKNYLIAIVVFCFTSNIFAEEKKFLAILKVNQTISLKEVSGRYDIMIADRIPQGYKVIEVNAEYIVVEDISGVNELSIPIYSIKSITRFKIKF